MSTRLTATEPRTTAVVPPLQAGDRLTRDEFLRRYRVTDTDHAELVEGVVYMPTPVSAEGHGEPHFDLIGWLFVYRTHTPPVRGGDNATLVLDVDNCPQPDGYLRILPEFGGQSRMVDGYVEGAPELVVEVAASTVSHDLHDKLNAYRRNGVREYVVWRTWDRAVDWFVQREGRFERKEPDADGVFRSEVFPGLWLDGRAVVEQDMPRVLAVLQQGLAGDAHREFMRRAQAIE
jgi:Uma2 family endonuclease